MEEIMVGQKFFAGRGDQILYCLCETANRAYVMNGAYPIFKRWDGWYLLSELSHYKIYDEVPIGDHDLADMDPIQVLHVGSPPFQYSRNYNDAIEWFKATSRITQDHKGSNEQTDIRPI